MMMSAAAATPLRCEINAKFACSSSTSCVTYKIDVFNIIDMQLGKFSRCDANGCDEYSAIFSRSGERASRASNSTEVQKNADGSVDVYFGPEAPEGKEANWVPPDPKRRFEVIFRLYAPTKPLFDKSWVLSK
jgi:hypothetical protein